VNNKLDEIGTALGNAKVELNNLIVEFKNNKPYLTNDEHTSHVIDIANKAIEVHDLDEKWHDGVYKEFMCEDDTHYFNDEYKYDESIRDDEHNDMNR